jgi:hypothetical protein
VSQQPFQPGQQPGQPGGYPQGGQPGYPQGGYPQPGQQQQYGGYQGASPGYGSRSGGGNPLNNTDTLATVLQILGYVVAALGVVGGFFAFAIDAYPGSLKFLSFAGSVVAGLGFGGVLLALSALLRKGSS